MAAITDKLADMMDFPCRYTLKVVGVASDDLVVAALAQVQAICPGDYAPKITPSSNGKYHSLTLAVQLQNKNQLEALYKNISALPEVKMVI